MNTKGRPNLGPLRLQLYHYSSDIPNITRTNVPPVYFQWVYQRNTYWRKYLSSLWVNVHSRAPLQQRTVKQRPLLPTDIEVGRISYDIMAKVLDNRIIDEEEDPVVMNQLGSMTRRSILRRRKANEACLLPNVVLHQISCGPQGSFVVRYSPTGKYIAAACSEKLLFTIKIFDAETGNHIFTFPGHHDIVYDLSWSQDETEIVSASSDGTAKVWNVQTFEPNAVLNLQHTNFVYTAQFHPKARNPRLILTGGFDGVIRIFSGTSGRLLSEMVGHKGHVNSLQFVPNGTRVFSADSEGEIKVWEDTGSTLARRDGDSEIDERDLENWEEKYVCYRTIIHDEIKGDAINCLRYHPRPEQLVAYGRDNAVYIFNLRRYELKRKLAGVHCRSNKLQCCISPDGRYLAAGSEDGKAYFWNLNTGELMNVLNVGYSSALFDISWHPSEHAVAFCSYGGDYPLLVYEFSKERETQSQLDPFYVQDTMQSI